MMFVTLLISIQHVRPSLLTHWTVDIGDFPCRQTIGRCRRRPDLVYRVWQGFLSSSWIRMMLGWCRLTVEPLYLCVTTIAILQGHIIIHIALEQIHGHDLNWSRRNRSYHHGYLLWCPLVALEYRAFSDNHPC